MNENIINYSKNKIFLENVYWIILLFLFNHGGGSSTKLFFFQRPLTG